MRESAWCIAGGMEIQLMIWTFVNSERYFLSRFGWSPANAVFLHLRYGERYESPVCDGVTDWL